MPPKAAATAAPSDGTSLTPGETKMLAVVCVLLGDVPKVDFEEVAKACGIKYGRNARSSCKRLFDKIKAAHPEVNVVDSGSGSTVSEAPAEDGSEDNEGAEAPKRAARTAPKKAPAKKTVGKTTAPKKATASSKKAPAKKGAAGKAKATAVIKEDSDDADVEDAEEDAVEPMKEDAGKVPIASAIITVSSLLAQPETEAVTAGDLVSGLDQLVDGSLATSLAVPASGHLVAETSSADAAEATPARTVDEAPATSVGVPQLGQLVADASSASVGVSPPGLSVTEASTANAAVFPADEPITAATSVAVDALAYFVTEVLYMNINGYDYAYQNQDIIDAQLHGVTLEHWILRKFENNADRAAVCGR